LRCFFRKSACSGFTEFVFQAKGAGIESLRSLCKDPVLLTQIFLNYDCDFDAKNLYKDIVHILTKLGGKTTSDRPGFVGADAEENTN
jgi:hypothetical protein